MSVRLTSARPRSAKRRAAASSSALRVRRPELRVARAAWRTATAMGVHVCTPNTYGGSSGRGGAGADPLPARLEDLAEDGDRVAHEPVDAEVEETLHLGAVVDGPDVHRQAAAVGGPEQCRGDQGDGARPDRDLQAVGSLPRDAARPAGGPRERGGAGPHGGSHGVPAEPPPPG